MNSETVLLTGASSFVGAHLAVGLAKAGKHVMATHSRPRAQYSGIRDRRLRFVEQHRIQTTVLDVTEPNDIRAVIGRHRPDICLHHAGWVQDYGSYDYDLTAGRAVHAQPLPAIFDTLAEIGAAGIVITGTSAEYGASSTRNQEDEACYPPMPYGLSKLEATIRAGQLAERTGIKARVARLFIPFGPLDAPGKLVPQVIDALSRGQPVDLSPGTQYRDFLHIDDLVDGYLRLLGTFERPEGFRIYNLCSGTPLTVKDLLIEIARGMGADESLLRFGARAMREGEAPFSCGDNHRAISQCGFAPRPLREAVAAYLDTERTT